MTIDHVLTGLSKYYDEQLTPMSATIKHLKNAVMWWIKGEIKAYSALIPIVNGSIFEPDEMFQALKLVIFSEKPKHIIPLANIGITGEDYDIIVQYIKKEEAASIAQNKQKVEVASNDE